MKPFLEPIVLLTILFVLGCISINAFINRPKIQIEVEPPVPKKAMIQTGWTYRNCDDSCTIYVGLSDKVTVATGFPIKPHKSVNIDTMGIIYVIAKEEKIIPYEITPYYDKFGDKPIISDDINDK